MLVDYGKIDVRPMTEGDRETKPHRHRTDRDERSKGDPADRDRVPFTPQDIANAFLFLSCDLSSYVTGVVLDVNGGLHIH